MVAPSVVYNGDGCVGLRRFLLHEASVERFYGFENRRKVFPIHSSYKFVSLVFLKGESEIDTFRAAFMRHDLDELQNTARYRDVGHATICEEPAPWIVNIRREEIEALSPETSAFLEYRGAMDQAIVQKMYRHGQTLRSKGAGSWEARLFTDLAHMQIYNTNRDKDLWTDPTSRRLYDPHWVLSQEPSELAETLERMYERGFWPVFEGKHIDQFVVGIKPLRWWLSVEQVERKYSRPPRAEPTLVFRNIASNTNERTCIAAVLPPFSAMVETLTAVLVEEVDPDSAAAVLNSLPFDWALRLRTAGTHVSFTYIQPMPVPAADKANRLPGFRTRLAWETGLGHITEDESSWPDLWAANRSVAEAYGLGPAEFEHILSTFPGFARKRPAFHAYLRARLSEWSEEVGEKDVGQSYADGELGIRLPRVAEKSEHDDIEET
jgi:hypothetical protein